MTDNEISIEKLIVHILDSSVGMPVLSDNEHPVNSDIRDFIGKHVIKIFKDPELKSASFKAGDNLVRNLANSLKDNREQFIELTRKLAEALFNIMKQNASIPSADLVVSLASIKQVPYLVILKFNYKTCYIHHVESLDNQTTNKIIKQMTTLPSENQKIDECIFIDLESNAIKIMEKKYELEGEKQFYLSPLFLNCTSDISVKEKIKIMEKTADNLIKKHYGKENLEKKVEFRHVINEHVEDNLSVDVEKVANTVFGKIPEVKNDYIDGLEKKGVTEKEFQVSSTAQEKSLYKKQKIVTDTGIEINLPVSEYQNKEKIEFITNPDGTISILLKNIKKYK